jgi:tetratricopeptide (TPR) repeat protein
MITRFSNLQQITVRPTSAIFKYAEQPYDAVTVGGRLGVDAVLEGTVQQDGDRVRVTVQMVRVSDGKTIWVEKLDEQMTNIFTLQDSISDQAAHALNLWLTKNEKEQFTRRYTEDCEAYQDYVRGVFFWNKRTEEGLTRSIEYFKQAIEKDPQYALAWAGLADAYAVNGYVGYKFMSQEESYQKAQEAAARAIEIDQTMADAYVVLSIVKAYYEGSFPAAEEEIKKAIALHPKNATAHHRYAIYLRDQGKLDEALKESLYARQLDPLSSTIGSNLAYIYYLQRDYEQAEKHCRRVLETEPNYHQTIVALGMIYQQQKKFQDAITLLEQIRPENKGKGAAYVAVLETLGTAYARAGFRQNAEKIILELNTVPRDKAYITFYQALIYASLDQPDKAFTLLEAGYTSWDYPPLILAFDPRFDSLRSDDRYTKLLKSKTRG